MRSLEKNTAPIIVEQYYDAPVAMVWEALTHREKMNDWYFTMDDFQPREGFSFRFTGQGKQGQSFIHLCSIVEVILHKKLSHSWRYEGYEGNSVVTWELSEEAGGTRLRLTHAGLESFPKTPDDDFEKKNFEEGWNYITGTALKNFIEKK